MIRNDTVISNDDTKQCPEFNEHEMCNAKRIARDLPGIFKDLTNHQMLAVVETLIEQNGFDQFLNVLIWHASIESEDSKKYDIVEMFLFALVDELDMDPPSVGRGPAWYRQAIPAMRKAKFHEWTNDEVPDEE